MIPYDGQFFYQTKQNQTKELKLLFMALQLSYLCLLGFLVTWIFGADALNALLQMWFNIIFFVCCCFAASF
jgi:thiol:disulfide interchange protein DsbD